MIISEDAGLPTPTKERSEIRTRMELIQTNIKHPQKLIANATILKNEFPCKTLHFNYFYSTLC